MPYTLQTIEAYFTILSPLVNPLNTQDAKIVHERAAQEPADFVEGNKIGYVFGKGTGPSQYSGNRLHRAILQENLQEIVNALEEEPGLMDQTDEYNLPPIAYVLCTKKKRQILSIFVKNLLFDINKDIVEGNTLLHLVAQSSEHDILSFVLRECNDINLENEQGQTALLLASQYGSPTVVQYLLDKNANIKLSLSGSSPLSVAHFYGRSEIQKKLAQKSAEIISQCMKAIKEKDSKTVEEIFTLHSALNFNIKDTEGRNLLHLACSTGDSSMIYLVKEKYPNLLLEPDDEGELPFAYCPKESQGLQLVVLGNTLSLAGENPYTDMEFEITRNTVCGAGIPRASYSSIEKDLPAPKEILTPEVMRAAKACVTPESKRTTVPMDIDTPPRKSAQSESTRALQLIMHHKKTKKTLTRLIHPKPQLRDGTVIKKLKF